MSSEQTTSPAQDFLEDTSLEALPRPPSKAPTRIPPPRPTGLKTSPSTEPGVSLSPPKQSEDIGSSSATSAATLATPQNQHVKDRSTAASSAADNSSIDMSVSQSSHLSPNKLGPKSASAEVLGSEEDTSAPGNPTVVASNPSLADMTLSASDLSAAGSPLVRKISNGRRDKSILLKRMESMRDEVDANQRKKSTRSLDMLSNRVLIRRQKEGDEGSEMNGSRSSLFAGTNGVVPAPRVVTAIGSPSVSSAADSTPTPETGKSSPPSTLHRMGSQLKKPGSLFVGLNDSEDSLKTNKPLDSSANPAQFATALRKTRGTSVIMNNLPMSTLQSTGNVTSPGSIKPSAPKSFKDYFANLLHETDRKNKSREDYDEFPHEIDLTNLFGFGGTRENYDVSDRIMVTNRCYEAAKAKPEWSLRPKTSSSIRDRRDDMALRVIDILDEGRLSGVSYQDAPAEGGIDLVMGGPAKDLLDALIFPLDQDMSYPEVFLATYRFFISSQEVLDSLIGWYNADAEENEYPGSEAFLRKNRRQIQSRALRVIIMWIKNHWHDFQNNHALEEDLECFVDYLAKVSFGNNQKIQQAIREQRIAWYTHQYIPLFPTSKAFESHAASASEWNETDFAQNLTMIDHLYFRQIKPEVYFQILHKPVKFESAGYNVALKLVLEYCAWFRLVMVYTATVVCKEDGTKKKMLAIKRFLKIARNCRDLGNYNTLFAIINGLKRPIVLMWSQAWEALPTKYTDLFRELETLTDPSYGYSKYWDVMKELEPPAIPFIAPYLEEMFEIHENAPTTISNLEITSLSEQKINFQKFYDMYSLAAELETFRMSSYHDKIKGDRDSNMMVISHMRSVALKDDKALGEGLSFASSEWTSTAAGASTNKALKRLTNMIMTTKESGKGGDEIHRSTSIASVREHAQPPN